MKAILKALTFAAMTAVAALFFYGTVRAEPLGQITSYTIPGGSGPSIIAEGHDGNLWISQETGKLIWKYDRDSNGQASGFTSYSTPDMVGSLVSGIDKSMWYASGTKVGKISESGSQSEYSLPSETVNQLVQNFEPKTIATGPDGRMWILAIGSNGGGTKLYRMNENGTIYAKYAIAGDTPIALVADFKNNKMWYNYRNTAGIDKVGLMTLEGQSTEWSVPGSMDDVFGMTVGPDDKLWFTGGAKVANITSSGNMSVAYDLPQGVGGTWQLKTGLDGNIWATTGMDARLVRLDLNDIPNSYVSSQLPYVNFKNPYLIGLTAGTDGNMWFTQYGVNKIGKIGTGTSGSTTDADNDGLTAAQELTQGTSDNVNDTDHDGLTDYIESQWYTNRDDVFCGIECAYPDPLHQDVYLEIDWMNKPNSYSAKPTNQQLSQMTAAFANKGMKVHTDTGEYGGGNQVPFNSPIWFTSVSGEKDFVDYKRGGDGISAHFDIARDDIWHYMVVGGKWQYMDDNNNVVTASSGVANASGPNLFVAYETVSDIVNQPLSGLNLDTALAGTITHELGHNLCLTSNQAYAPEPECHFEGIDNPAYTQPNYPYAGYNSAMNYAFQFTLPDYSTNPTASQYDHNDWAAIKPAEFVFFNEGANGQGGNAKAKTGKDKDRNKRIKNFKHEPAPSKYKKNNWHRKP